MSLEAMKAAAVVALVLIVTDISSSQPVKGQKTKCELKPVFYNYNQQENAIECNARIPVKVCVGQCTTTYSITTGRICSSCQPTNIEFVQRPIICLENGRYVTKTVKLVSALGCSCRSWNCGQYPQAKKHW
eukprot:Seg1278.7 transcript_id=Seg1278.7/GoldUCD/mRNA.D3Y31 product="hypothetical protein" protein_id=Seg1278.7/GoldUCD/D3Y31